KHQEVRRRHRQRIHSLAELHLDQPVRRHSSGSTPRTHRRHTRRRQVGSSSRRERRRHRRRQWVPAQIHNPAHAHRVHRVRTPRYHRQQRQRLVGIRQPADHVHRPPASAHRHLTQRQIIHRLAELHHYLRVNRHPRQPVPRTHSHHAQSHHVRRRPRHER